MKTLADLKRDAVSGKISLEMIERFGDTEDKIPKRLRGVRKVVGANTVCIKLQNLDGVESELRFDSAKLVEYTDDSLVIYSPALRDPNAEEQCVLNAHKRMIDEYMERNPYGESYWKSKDFFSKCACPWMGGYEKVRGKQYQTWSGKVQDWGIRGDVALRYIVHRVA